MREQDLVEYFIPLVKTYLRFQLVLVATLCCFLIGEALYTAEATLLAMSAWEHRTRILGLAGNIVFTLLEGTTRMEPAAGSYMALSVFILYVRCTAIDPADPGILLEADKTSTYKACNDSAATAQPKISPKPHASSAADQFSSHRQRTSLSLSRTARRTVVSSPAFSLQPQPHRTAHGGFFPRFQPSGSYKRK